MFGFIRNLFHASPPRPPGAPEPLVRLNELAPLRHVQEAAEAPEQSAAPKKSSFVCREAVLGRDQRIAGYDFSLHRSLQSRLSDRRELIHKVYDDALVRSLSLLGVDALLGHRLAFVSLTPASLANPQIARLPPGNLVLMLAAPQGYAMDADTAARQLAQLRARGVRVAWECGPDVAALGAFLAEADFAQLKVSAMDALQLRQAVAALRALARPAGAAPLKLIARDIESFEDFNLCWRSGFDHFHGPFVNSRENWHPPKSEINRVGVMQLLNEIRAGADNGVMAAGIKKDPVLTFKLLRYINSPALGLQRQITAIEQGLTVLGQEKFYRWLSLLLFDVKNPGYADWMLIERALVRARLMELVGKGTAGLNPDHLFLTGMFSMLDKLLGQSIVTVLSQLTLPQPVRAALLGEPSAYAPLLELAVLCEDADPDRMRVAAERCGVDGEALTRLTLDALAWTHEVTALSGS